MSNFSIDVNIHAPELVQAINNLAGALAKPVSASAPETAPAASAMPVAAAPVIPAAPAAATPPAPPAPPAPVPVSAPVAPPVPPAAPVSGAPVYTVDQLQIGAGQVMQRNPGASAQLQQLLVKYGVERLPELTPDQMGLFAADLRGLGAQI